MPNFSWRVKFDIQKDPPMGIAYIGAVLELNGYKVKIIDANVEELTLDAVMEQIMKTSPDFIGISVNYSPLNNLSIELCEKIKNYNKNIVICVGGNHATASYKYMLEKSNGVIDFVIRGQGETIILNLLESLGKGTGVSKVKGIAYIKNGKVVFTQKQELIKNLDEIPMPAYHLLNMNLYDRYNIVTSRGCPYRCTYCASSVIVDRVSYRSPENIVMEIEYLVNNYGQKTFWFSDDTFTSNFEHTNKLVDLIIKRNLKIKWSCLTRVNRTNKELLQKMKKSGCIYISYGVESGDTDMLERMNKKITLNQVREALKITKEIGIDMYTFFLIGYPGETIESVNKSFDLIREIKPTGASFAVVIPLPGTSLWDYLCKQGYLDFNKINWDYLFAKSGKDKYESYSAKLAATWCGIDEKKLVELCEQGQQLVNVL